MEFPRARLILAVLRPVIWLPLELTCMEDAGAAAPGMPSASSTRGPWWLGLGWQRWWLEVLRWRCREVWWVATRRFGAA